MAWGVIAMEWIRGSGHLFTPRPKPWVARLTGLDAKYGFAREFVRGTLDYSDARSTGSRGIMLYFALSPGFYEVFHVLSWRRDRRYFIHVKADGTWSEILRFEVEQCLKSGC